MPLFPSREWMEAFCDRVAAQPQADQVAGALDGRYRFIVDPGGPLQERHVYDVRIAPGDGGALASVVDGPPRAPRLTLAANYPRWRQLIRGELDVRMAVLLRRLRLSGDLAAVTSQRAAAQPLLRALGEVESRWLEERR